MRVPHLAERSPCHKGRLIEEAVGYFQLVVTEYPRSILPFMLRLSIPYGPKVFWYILDLVPRLAFTSCPPMNSAVFGAELIIELRMSIKSVCSNSSMG